MMNKYTPLHVHSHYSLLDGLSKPDDIAERIEAIGSDACALTDHASISGVVPFIKALKGKKKKPILGCELNVTVNDATIQDKDNREYNHLVVLAKNLQGWYDLIQAVSESNKPEVYYYKPRLDLARLSKYAQKGNLIAFSGHVGSHLSKTVFSDWRKAFNSKNKDDIGALVDDEKIKETIKLVDMYKDIFGKENFFVEIQTIDEDKLPVQSTLRDVLRYVAKQTNTKTLATPDAHYTTREAASDQRILLCSNLNTTIANINKKIADSEDNDVQMGGFFKSDSYHIPTFEEMSMCHNEAELANTNLIADMIEPYDIFNKPRLAQFVTPNQTSPDEYFKQLSRDGWRDKIQGKIDPSKMAEYTARIKNELDVLGGAGLSSYFLTVQDIVRYINSNGWLCAARGSAYGCLVSYLIGITDVDPIPYDLMFERFYNAGRNTADRVSMPDIDLDVPTDKRESIINYIKSRCGEANVAQIVTFHTLKGCSAIKDVLRAYGDVSFYEMNQITEYIPEEAKIADDLQEMRERDDGDESSIIRWALENNSKELKQWCYIDKDGKFQGPLAARFEQAIRLEGTKSSQSRHAAGVVISPEPLANICPMVFDNDGHAMTAFEMNELEEIGLIKFDILGVNLFDKLMTIRDVLKTGEL